MKKHICVGLIGLGTVGTGVAKIINSPDGRHPLVSKIKLSKIAVRDKRKSRSISIPNELITEDPLEIVQDPEIDVVVEVMGGIEPSRTLILSAIKSGKSVVTANKAVIARHGEEIAAAANSAGVYVLIEAAVGGGIPIIEPLKQSLGGNKIKKVSGIINGTTNYILTRMAKEGANYQELLKEAQELGYAEADPMADVEGLDAADKISILSGLAFGGHINRSLIPTKGISDLQNIDVNYANQLGYEVKLIAVAESLQVQKANDESLALAVRVEPTLILKEHPLAGVNGVNNAIFVEGDPIGEVMFYGPGAGSGPTASAVVADILNIAGIKVMGEVSNSLDPLLSAFSWRKCHLAKPTEIFQKNYLRLITKDTPGVIGQIGQIFGKKKVSIQSIVQFDSNDTDAEIVVITHQVNKGLIKEAITEIENLLEVKKIAAHMSCL
ncbi:MULTISPECIES: homoserine dehydrogenase [Prochlorococcus]|uniref:homoserine dehydrogenase n=1 Tax=Prochlorococcus TaxID=1218 RepID=UPI0005337707|nr:MULTISPECIES: homoserine dehydrogenase [Prochlorococcus]KGG12210.1 Homoserine dehydrogenase [Prochlorococcus sp. MIT 0601]